MTAHKNCAVTKLFIITSIIFFLSSCSLIATQDGERNKEVAGEECTLETTTDCPNQVVFHSKDNTKSLGVVEINEQGQYIDRSRAEKVFSMVEMAKEKSLFVLFVHGWNHNAAETDENYKAFQRVIDTLYKNQSSQEKRNIVGLYVGWRGRVYPGWLNFSTFWDRKNVSEEVGRGALKDFVLRTERAIKVGQGTFILIGHSFGGSALFNAIEPIIISRFYLSLEHKRPFNSVGDMVFLVNPAIEAMRFAQFRETIWREGLKDPSIFNNNMKPVFISMGGSDDFDTQFYFPIGRYPSTFFENHRDIALVKDITGRERVRNEVKMDRVSIGNYSPFYTHWINLVKDYDGKADLVDFCGKDRQWLWASIYSNNDQNYWDTTHYKDRDLIYRLATRFVPSGTWKDKDLIDENRINTTWKTNPYWFVRASSNMIQGHNGFWNTNTACLVLNLISAESPIASEKSLNLTPARD